MTELAEETMLLSLWDIKAQKSSDLMCMTIDEAESYFNLIVNTHLETPQHLYPEDFIVHTHGYWNDGKIYLLEERGIYGSLAAYRKPCKYCDAIASTELRTDYDYEEQKNGC